MSENLSGKMEVDYGDIHYQFTYQSLNYRVLLFGKVLFKIPSRLGKWLFSKGYAVECYRGVKEII